MKSLIVLSRLSLVFAALTLASCAGARFERDWNQAVAAHTSGEGAKDPVAGPWTGTWLSHVNGHDGTLRCLVTPLESASGATGETSKPYRFRYRATWQKVLSGGYTADYTVVPQGKRGYQVDGVKDLGLFGNFQHEGQILGDRFESTYASDMGDHGVFELKRP